MRTLFRHMYTVSMVTNYRHWVLCATSRNQDVSVQWMELQEMLSANKELGFL